MEQENNNFETIVTTWRRLSGEKIEPASMSISGDTPNTFDHLKKKDDMDMLRGDKFKVPTITVASGSTAVAVADAATDTDLLDPDEKPLFTHHDSEESKETACDIGKKKDSDYLESNDENADLPKKQSTHSKSDEKLGDKVDSVYLRPKPPHKVRSRESAVAEEENCGMTCLICVLNFCDCTIQ